MALILASQSPRRRELMGLFGIPFTVRVADVDETMEPGKDPYEQVALVSRRKAFAIPRENEDVVVAADTVVVCNRQILGKPESEEKAYEMLRLLSGRDHQVMTGMTVLRGHQCRTVTEVTDIHFRELSEKEIRRYIATKEPMDKAGSYGIQGGAALFAEKLVGDYYNVVGLPVCRLWQLLGELAPELLESKEDI